MRWRPNSGIAAGDVALAAAFGFCLWRIITQAWVCEDAYITFRVIDNAVHGYGLRWNVHERVQVYTHPLWMLLHLPFYWLWQNIFLITIGLGIACSSAALAVSLRSFSHRPALAVAVFFLLPLAFAPAFYDYATSGLEGSLSMLLFSCFAHCFMKDNGPRRQFHLALFFALAMVNRLDSVVIYAPALLYSLPTRRQHVNWKQWALGLLPLAGWLLFSLFYYGFIFPNTKVAKLDTGIAYAYYVESGIAYARNLFMHDLVSASLLIFAFAAPLAFWPALKHEGHERRYLALWAGVMCANAYVVLVGGDYMQGRFFTLPVFASAWLLAFLPLGKPRMVSLGLLAVALVFATNYSEQTQTWKRECKECKKPKPHMINARRMFQRNALFSTKGTIRTQPEYVFVARGKKLAEEEEKPFVRPYQLIGMSGFYAGRDVILLDRLGLGDALMARLPAKNNRFTMYGHFLRDVPTGYVHAVKTGDLSEMEPQMAAYYQPLRLIISGDLWNWERIKTIVLFNMGHYDSFKQTGMK